MKCTLICGFTKHGKDHFFNSVMYGIAHEGYQLYSKDGKPFYIHKRPKRLAFADTLKDEYLKIKYPYGDHNALRIELETYKDVPDINGIKPRDELIVLAKDLKDTHGEDIFVDLCLQTETAVYTDSHLFITDFRNINEYTRSKEHVGSINTLRVFRPSKEIPISESEIQLNEFQTDFLVVSKQEINISEKCFNYEGTTFPMKLIETFPFYASYRPSTLVYL